MAVKPGRCPVCNARFRGTALCSRCGADLEPLMRIAARAFALRRDAREALLAEHPDRALELTAAAERLQSTPEGRGLLLLCRCLREPAP